MWIAVFVNLACTICMPVEVGQFEDQVACLRWVAREESGHPKFRGKCERRMTEPKERKA